VDMADPATLQSFITWAVANYPADHYALMLADHGYGWQGMMIDETSNGDFMTVKGVVSALKNSGVHFNLLALNACTMQMIEVMHELLEVPIDIVVGSENLGTTWAFTQILQAITDDPNITAANLGKEICDFYYDIHAADTTITLSTIQLDNIPDVEDALADFCTTILDSVAFEVIQPKAQAIMDAIEDAVLYKVSGEVWDDAGGLSIYWPPMDQGYMPHVFFYSYIDEIISFSVDNPWREYLYVFYNLWTYPGIIPGEIYQVYDQLSFFDDNKIDLYDFCKRIVEYQAP
ncbi:MAG: clostripain-related cysteine peptidase, partial [Candidatus Celaenobacter polaris]|nr:clostripain-related cysteine peptidase [Candidatus Celaenobacter polaris]